MSEKARHWVAVLYLENMVSSWEDDISSILQLPFAYCIHRGDLDSVGEHRKDHVHIMMSFPNTTTYKHAFSVFEKLSAPNKIALNKIEAVINVRFMYEYLIHNTDDSRKKKKHLYPVTDRITGNNFDIGLYEQLSVADKDRVLKELCNCICECGYTNFMDFYLFVVQNYEDGAYFEVMRTYANFLSLLIKGNYQKFETFKGT